MTDITTSNSLADLAARINAEHRAMGDAFLRGIDHAINAGELLIEAKEQLRHGEWLGWLEENCSVSPRAAQMYMQIAKKKGHNEISKAKKISHLGINDALGIIRRAEIDAQFQRILDRSPDLPLKEEIIRESRGVILQEQDDERRNILFSQENWRTLKVTQDDAVSVNHLAEERDGLIKRAEKLEAQAKELRKQASDLSKKIRSAVRQAFTPDAEAAE